MSLRARLLAGMAFVAAILVLVSVVITVTTRDRLIAEVDGRLESFAPSGPDGAPARGPDHDQPFRDDPPRSPDGAPERISDAYEGYVDAGGTLRTRFAPNVGDEDYSAPAIDTADLPATGSRTFTTDSVSGDQTYRVLAQRDGDVTLITAFLLDDVRATISRLVVVEVLGFIVILAALGLVAWWVVHLGIRPVKEMTETATRIAEGDLAVRVPETAPGTESGALAVALNQMLGRIGRALDERAESEERLRRFVADASHELRTPVTTIRGYAELYRRGGLGEPAALDDAMRRTEQEAVRMGRLVEEMLQLAKLDEQRPLDVRTVDLAGLGRDAVTDARAAAPRRTIDLEVDAPTAIVEGDEDRLRQVIANIVDNAIVHTEPDVPIVVRVRGDGRDVTLEVQDRGQGMPAEVAERVTERFFRADPARSRRRGGSGLGLSIVDAVVAAHGGTVTVESAPGAGTTVRLVLTAAGH